MKCQNLTLNKCQFVLKKCEFEVNFIFFSLWGQRSFNNWHFGVNLHSIGNNIKFAADSHFSVEFLNFYLI